MPMIHGSCLCGAVGWRLDGALEFIALCHCSVCRRFTGSAYGAYGHALSHGFAFTQGEGSITRYTSSPGNERWFCPTCGAPVPVLEGDEVLIPAGGIEGDPGVRPSAHIFVASKAPWHTITDDLPQHDAFPEIW